MSQPSDQSTSDAWSAPGLLLERAEALDTIAHAAARAKNREGYAVFLLGDGGMGKTSLLNAVAAIVPSPAVTRAQGYWSEMELPFALTEQLFGPLPQPNPVAREGRTGSAGVAGSSASNDPLELGLRYHQHVRAALRHLAEPHGALILIDDLHWADRHSLATLAFALRRLEGLPILVIATLRPWPPDAAREVTALVREGRAAALTLDPLSEGASRALLERRGYGTLSAGAVHRAWLRTGGNPYLLTSLADTSNFTNEHEPELGPNTDAIVAGQLAGLSDPSIRLAEIAAVLGAPIDLAVCETISGLAPSEFADTLDALIKARVLVHDPTIDLRFAHDLLAEALLHALPPGRQRFLHQRAFEVLAARGEFRSAAVHAVRAPLTGDGDAARLLAEAGADALSRGDIGTATHLLSAATRLWSEAAPTTLLVDYAEALFLAGGAGEAVPIYREAAHRTTLGSSEQANVLAKLARAMAFTGQLDDAIATLRDLAAQAQDQGRPAPVTWIAEHAHLVWERDGPVRAAMELDADLVTHDIDPESRPEFAILAALRSYFAFQSGLSTAFDRLEAIVASHERRHTGSSRASFELTHLVTSAWAINERYEAATRAIEDALSRFESVGAARAAIPLRILRMGINLRQGEYRATLLEAEDLATEIDLDALQAPHAALLQAEALTWLGKSDRAGAILDAMEGSRHTGSWFGQLNLRVARGEHLLTLGRPEAALEQFRQCQALVTRFGIGHPQLPRWCGGAIEASFSADDPDALEEILDWLEPQRDPVFGTWPELVAQGGLAARLVLEGNIQGALDAYEVALAQQGPHPLDRMRIMLRYGRLLRRERNLREARRVLADTLALAAAHGVVPLADVARSELAAAGGRRRAKSPGDAEGLTPQEQRAATLAAEGATVKEIAASMYLSPRTVESHLGRVYRKLGVTSKAELRRRVAPATGSSPQHRTSQS